MPPRRLIAWATLPIGVLLLVIAVVLGRGDKTQHPLHFVPGLLSNGCHFSARGLPSCGTYFGSAYGANTDPARLEAQIGHHLGIHRTYYFANQVDAAVSTARDDIAHGRLPWLSLKTPYSWKEMADGRGDRWATDLASKLSELRGPVWLAIHHEPEGDGDLTQWRTMQEHLAPLVRNTAPNVAYTVILTGYDQLYGPSEYHLARIWPHTKVDVAGFDVYNSPTMTAGYLVPLSKWAKSQHVHWGLAETGYTDAESISDPQWIYRTYRSVAELGGIAFTYFDSAVNSSAPWPLSTTGKRQDFARAQKLAPSLPVE
jgi:hypothetical protein